MRPLKICVVYDHVYPATIGGGERWLHDLSQRLQAEGHKVTYVTMRHWAGAPPALPGIEVVAVAPAGRVRDDERRTALAPLRFGFGVARFLWHHGGRFDVVHVAAFPYFGLLAAALMRRRHRFLLVADWFEAWSRAYWIRYAGRVTGHIGWRIQRACVRIPAPALCISEHTAKRLREEGHRGQLVVLPGLYAGPVEPSTSGQREPLVVTASRQIPEKRVPLLVEAFAIAHDRHPELRLEIFGDGPELAAVEATIRRLHVDDCVEVRGHRPQDEVEDAMSRAACVASASEREGYGLTIVEAAARGTPSVIVAAPENAAGDLVHDAVNGAVAREPTAVSLAGAISRVVESGAPLRASTATWFARNAKELRLESSFDVIVDLYEREA